MTKDRPAFLLYGKDKEDMPFFYLPLLNFVSAHEISNRGLYNKYIGQKYRNFIQKTSSTQFPCMNFLMPSETT